MERGLLRGRPEVLAEGGKTRAPVSGARRAILGATSVTHLRRSLPLLGRYGRSRQVVLAVISTDRPDLLSIPQSLTRDTVESADLRVIDGGAGGIVIRLDLRRRTSVQDVVRAVLAPARRGGASWPAAGLRLGLSEVTAAAWAAGDPWARTVTPAAMNVAPDDIFPVDLVVGRKICAEPLVPLGPPSLDPQINGQRWSWAATAERRSLAGLVDASAADVDRPGIPWRVAAPVLPPVDITTVSPRGFLTNPTAGEARARWRAGKAGWDVFDDGQRRLVTLSIEEGIGEDAIARLREMRRIVVNPSSGPGPVEMATLLATLATAGIPTILTEPLPGVTSDLLGPVGTALAELGVADTEDDLAREAWSVRNRRQAMLRFGTVGRWQAFGAQLGLATSAAASISVIIPTKRAKNVSFALAQVDRQSWPHIEIVLALHGVQASDPVVRDAISRTARPLHVVEVDDCTVFGDVLNAALDRCSGRFVAKMDDDDWYGPDHVTDLLLAHDHSSATLVGLADHYVYLAETDMTVRDVAHGTERWAARVSGGTLAIAREDLLTVGGWRPVRRAVDRCLIQAVRAQGGHLYAMHDLGFCLYRGAGEGHTWNPGDDHFVARSPMTWPGFVPPPELQPIPHPALGGR